MYACVFVRDNNVIDVSSINDRDSAKCEQEKELVSQLTVMQSNFSKTRSNNTVCNANLLISQIKEKNTKIG